MPADSLKGKPRDGLGHLVPWAYVAVALLITVLLAILTPPFFVPDEPNHSFREFQIASGEVTAQITPQGAGGRVDSGLVSAVGLAGAAIDRETQLYPRASTRPPGRIAPMELAALQSLRWTGQERFVPFPNTAVYSPVLYLPQAAGWGMGRHLHWSIVHSLLLARLCAAAAAIVLGWLALRLCAAGRGVLFVILLLPASLSLIASASQDAVLFSTGALAAALLSRPLHLRRQFFPWELYLCAAALAVFIGARVPYLPLVLVLFLPAVEAEGFRLWNLRAPLLAAVAVVLYVGAWQLHVRRFPVAVSADANMAAQKAWVLSHPLHATVVVARSVLLAPVLTLRYLQVLGVNDVLPPLPVVAIFAFSVLALALLQPVDCLRTTRARWLLLGSALLSALGLSCAEYLVWSAPGAASVGGVQARYYVAMLPFLMFLLPQHRLLTMPKVFQLRIVAALYAAILVAVCSVPWLAATGFYNMGVSGALRFVVR